MAAKKDFTIHKTKTMECGHQQRFSTPVPVEGNVVFCHTCRTDTLIPKKNRHYKTVAEGAPRRLKKNPRSNNQYTKGRKING